MAHTLCINDHAMWNGDGKVCVDAYPLNFVKEISEQNPNKKLGDNDDDYWLLVDIYDSYPEKEPDIWRCTECLSLAIFFMDKNHAQKKRYDYIVDDIKNLPSKNTYLKWEKYFVENDDACEYHYELLKNKGLTPYESFEVLSKESNKLNFAYVSNDKENIVVTNNLEKPIRFYKLTRELDL